MKVIGQITLSNLDIVIVVLTNCSHERRETSFFSLIITHRASRSIRPCFSSLLNHIFRKKKFNDNENNIEIVLISVRNWDQEYCVCLLHSCPVIIFLIWPCITCPGQWWFWGVDSSLNGPYPNMIWSIKAYKKEQQNVYLGNSKKIQPFFLENSASCQIQGQWCGTPCSLSSDCSETWNNYLCWFFLFAQVYFEAPARLNRYVVIYVYRFLWKNNFVFSIYFPVILYNSATDVYMYLRSTVTRPQSPILLNDCNQSFKR